MGFAICERRATAHRGRLPINQTSAASLQNGTKKVEVIVKRSHLLLVFIGSLALLSGCAAAPPPPAPPIEKPGISIGADGSVTHRLCFTKDNSATCVVKTRKPNGSTEIKITSEPLN
jgi:hypothetical protein